MYEQLEGRFKVSGGVGGPWKATNGIMQGCPLPVILLKLLVTAWAKAVDVEVPGCTPDAYAGDAGGAASKAKDVQAALDLTGEFADLTGQELSPSKCYTWATDATERRKTAGPGSRMRNSRWYAQRSRLGPSSRSEGSVRQGRPQTV